MEQNPYTSKIFTSTWLKHFNPTETTFAFKSFPLTNFVKSTSIPVYFNLGKTNTKGVYYKVTSTIANELKNRTCILFDVPDFYCPQENSIQPLLKIKQYPAYRCDFNGFDNLDQYMLQVLSKKSRYKFRSNVKKLNQLKNINYKVFYGEIETHTYTQLFTKFKSLLECRFKDKRITNNNISDLEWPFFQEVSLPMIRNKEAAMFVMYDGDKPIAITLTNLSKSVMFDVIRVFDIEYAKLRIGTVSIMKQMEWCFNNNIKTLDFSKGLYEYKERWANIKYWQEYHIYYNKNSITSLSFASYYYMLFKLKFYLREHGLLKLINKTLFTLSKNE